MEYFAVLFLAAFTGGIGGQGLSPMLSGSEVQMIGESYNLTCTVSGEGIGPTTYQWHRNGTLLTALTTISFSETTETSQTLTFSPLRDVDAGLYTCTVMRDSMTGTSISVPINVRVPIPEQPEVSITSASTSITLSWTQPSSGGHVDNYTVQYNVSVRGCSDIPHWTNSTTLNSGTFFLTISNLEEDSIITGSVAAVNIAGTNSTTFTTNTATARPGMIANLTSTNTSSSRITVTWDELSCVDTNGEITGHRIEYGTTNFNRNQIVTTERSFSASGLLPLTSYSFRVAAINANGIGSYSAILDTSTSFPSEVLLRYIETLPPNNSIVDLEGITEGNNLFCLTNTMACCKHRDTGSGPAGHWFFPNGNRVPTATTGFYIKRDRSSVALTYAATAVQQPSGMYRCLIVDSNGHEVALNAGIYPNDMGTPRIESRITYNFTSSVLTCISSGGPATTVTWTKNSVPILQYAATQHQQLTDTSTATYHNLLTITSRNITDYNGTFTCTVSNSRGNDTLSQAIKSSRITDNRLFQLGETTSIACSTPVPVQSIQWVDESNTVVRNGVTVQELRLHIIAHSSHNNSVFTCTVMDGSGFIESEEAEINIETPAITVQVGGMNTPTEGSPFTLYCNVSGHQLLVPTVMYQWLINSSVVSNQTESTLMFNSIDRYDNGTYTCQVTINSPFLDGSDITAQNSTKLEVIDPTAPRVPDVISATSTQTTIIISWSFTFTLDSRNETFTVMYGTTPGELSMTSPPVLSMPSVQQYSVQLVSLQPGTRYYYQIHSTNRFESFTSIVESLKTRDARSAAVRNISLNPQDDFALVMTWQPPASPNGDILYYTVRVTLHSNAETISEGNTTDNMYTSTGLDSGIPYNMSVWAVNLAGRGEVATLIAFTNESTPTIAPRDFRVVRLTGAIMELFWTPLTLCEARGFVTAYTVSYTQLDSGQLEEQQEPAIRNSGSIVTGLQDEATYLVQVWASTSAGDGERSANFTVPPLPAASNTATPKETRSTGAIIGGVVAVIVVLILAITTLALIVRQKHKHITKEVTKEEFESTEENIYNVIDEDHMYEEVMKKSAPHYSAVKAKDEIDLKPCPAYASVTKPDPTYEMIPRH